MGSRGRRDDAGAEAGAAPRAGGRGTRAARRRSGSPGTGPPRRGRGRGRRRRGCARGSRGGSVGGDGGGGPRGALRRERILERRRRTRSGGASGRGEERARESSRRGARPRVGVDVAALAEVDVLARLRVHERVDDAREDELERQQRREGLGEDPRRAQDGRGGRGEVPGEQDARDGDDDDVGDVARHEHDGGEDVHVDVTQRVLEAQVHEAVRHRRRGEGSANWTAPPRRRARQ